MRLEARSAIWNLWMPSDQAGPSGTVASSLIQSVHGSPNISGIGLNLRPVSFADDIGFLNTKNVLNSVPGTPKEIPGVLPTLAQSAPLLETASWDIPMAAEPTVQSAVESVVKSTVESSSSSSIDKSPQQIVDNISTTQQILDRASESLVASTSHMVSTVDNTIRSTVESSVESSVNNSPDLTQVGDLNLFA